jgi:hypothetical protein
VTLLRRKQPGAATVMKRDQRILEAYETLKAAKAAYDATVAMVQEECEHPLILERGSGSTGYQYIENRWCPAVRVCMQCGYVEEARYGWPAFETTHTPLYNTKPKSKSILNHVDFQVDDARLHKELVPRA